MRSWLCVSCLNKNALKNAIAAKADVLNLDLEDSVPLDKKEEARMRLGEHMSIKRNMPIALRINSVRSLEGLRDLLFLDSHKLAPDIIIVPKAIPEIDSHIVGVLTRRLKRTKVFLVIETLHGFNSFVNSKTISSDIQGVILGAADLSVDLGVNVRDHDALGIRTALILAAKRLKLMVVDSPCFDIEDTRLLDQQCKHASTSGFDGKIAIHPQQVGSINRLFARSVKEVEFAKSIVSNEEQLAKYGVLKDGSSMIGPPFVKYAKKVLGKSHKFSGSV